MFEQRYKPERREVIKMWLAYTLAVSWAECDSLNEIDPPYELGLGTIQNCASETYWEAVEGVANDYFNQFDYFDWSEICPAGEAYYNGTCTEFVCVPMVVRRADGSEYSGMSHCVPRSSCGATITPSPLDLDHLGLEDTATGTLEECTSCDRYILAPYDGRIVTEYIDGVTRTVCPNIVLAPLPNCLLALPNDTEYCEADYDDCCADPLVDNCWDSNEQCYKDVHKVNWVGNQGLALECPEPTTNSPARVIVLIAVALFLAFAIYLATKPGPL